jgi:hypothetical protein
MKFDSDGRYLGETLVPDNRISGVAFTGLADKYIFPLSMLESKEIRNILSSLVGQMGLLIITGSPLSRSENAVPTLTLYIIFSMVRKYIENIQVSLKSVKNNGYFK